MSICVWSLVLFLLLHSIPIVTTNISMSIMNFEYYNCRHYRCYCCWCDFLILVFVVGNMIIMFTFTTTTTTTTTTIISVVVHYTKSNSNIHNTEHTHAQEMPRRLAVSVE